MVRRKQNFFAAKNRGKAGSVLWNNAMREVELERRKEEKRRKQDARRRAREDARRQKNIVKERERVAKAEARKKERREREKAKEAKQKEKELAREKKLQGKRLEKLKKYEARATAELEKIGIFSGKELLREIALNAEKIDITIAQIKSNLIDGKEDELRKIAGALLVNSQIKEIYRQGADYNTTIKVAGSLNPQTISNLRKECSAFVEALNNQKKKEENRILSEKREKFFTEKHKATKKVFFSDDLYEIEDFAEENNLTIEEIEKSEKFLNGLKQRENYKKELSEFIGEFQ